jgi:DNA polymerase-1
MTRFAILDVSFLAHRIFHTYSTLSNNGQPTEIIYGLMKTCQHLEDRLLATLVFCFDGGYDYRKAILPSYKAARAEKRALETDDEKELRQSFHSQLARFRDKILPGIGVTNIGYTPGYEADDMIASCVKASYPHKAFIVSTDEDLWQLLDDKRVACYRPTRDNFYTEATLMEEYGVTPAQWPEIKAYAGCSSDSIPGLKGVGNKTAAKRIKGEKCKEALFADSEDVYTRNMLLTKLPAPGTPDVVLDPDEKVDWDIVAAAIGAEWRDKPLPGIRPR